MSSKGFSLTEILIAMSLMGLVILAVASVDITSRRFFGTAKDETWIQDEAKIAMQHIISRVQRGVGNMSRPGAMGDNPNAVQPSSRGFYILSGDYVDFDNPGLLTDSGSRLWVKIDINRNGRFDSGTDQIVEYQEINNSIRFYPDVTDRDNYESLADGIVESAIFDFIHSETNPELSIPNRVDVVIQVLREPGTSPSLDNPETTLTSSIILRAMSIR